MSTGLSEIGILVIGSIVGWFSIWYGHENRRRDRFDKIRVIEIRKFLSLPEVTVKRKERKPHDNSTVQRLSEKYVKEGIAK